MPNAVSPTSNKELYLNAEFCAWAHRENLDAEETYLIGKYLDKSKRTLEAGTAGGRILLALQNSGFIDLHGFDYVSEFIDTAKKRDTSKEISFTVQDATSLHYQHESFDQVLYLQQIISSIDLDVDRLKSLRESHRILRKGGVGLLSFLSFEVRSSSFPYSWYIFYLKMLRQLKKSNVTIQHLPWMLHGGKFNLNALVDRPPYTYWYRAEEISIILKEIGFKIVSIGTTEQIKNNSMKSTCQDLIKEQLGGTLYIVVEK
jgi:ubiquinone/menaquinone biosynthesis C-methylase UbiE